MERIHDHEIPKGLMDSMRQLGAYLKTTGLDGKLIELLKVRVSQINGCGYCLDMHSKLALQAGETEQRLIVLPAWRDTSLYTPQERAVLTFAERLTRIATDELPEDLHDELKEFFTVTDIANLSFAIGQINAWNRIVKSCGTVGGNYKVS